MMRGLLIISLFALISLSCGSQLGDDVPSQQVLQDRVRDALTTDEAPISTDSTSVIQDSVEVNP